MIAEQEQEMTAPALLPRPRALRFLKAPRKHTSPPAWARAFEQYVTGQLPTLADVALYLNCNSASVSKRASKEHWNAARETRTKAIMELVQQQPGLELRRGKAALEEIQATQDTLAKSLLATGQTMAALALRTSEDVALLSAKLVDMQACDPAVDPSIRRISALSSLSESLLGQVRILAGLPNPDKVQRSIAQQPEPVRPSSSSRPAMPESLPDNAS